MDNVEATVEKALIAAVHALVRSYAEINTQAKRAGASNMDESEKLYNVVIREAQDGLVSIKATRDAAS